MSAHSCRIGAMKDVGIGVAAICEEKLYVVFDNGLTLPIIEFLDVDRNPLKDDDEARFYHFGNDENGYGVGNYDTYFMVSYADH